MSHIAHKKTILTFDDIIAKSVVDANGCWLWQGRLSPKGYAVAGKSDRVRVARFAWEIKNKREMRNGLQACHHCDVRKCVNPEHVYDGTPSDNINDAYERGLLVATRHTQALTNEQVAQVKYWQWRKSNREIARIFGVSHATINKIFAGKRYKDIMAATTPTKATEPAT